MKMPTPLGFWTEEKVAEAKQMWLGGFSAADICQALGATSRSAVLGRIHREKWPAPERVVTEAKKSSGRKRTPRVVCAPPIEEPIIEQPINAAELSFRCDGGITILELSTESCRWPLGNPQQKDFRYCGADKQFGVSYCVRHSRVAFAGFSR